MYFSSFNFQKFLGVACFFARFTLLGVARSSRRLSPLSPFPEKNSARYIAVPNAMGPFSPGEHGGFVALDIKVHLIFEIW
jgi:hypothetical protein